MKGIILAGGLGTRLRPLTTTVSKQLLPVYNKPMVYYPISTLILAGIRDIMIITTPEHVGLYRRLLGNGEKWGITLTYGVQDQPNGIAQAFIIAKEFIGDDCCVLILGDNIFLGKGMEKLLYMAREEISNGCGAVLFGYKVKDPERFGVLEIGINGEVLSVEEKPQKPKSNYCAAGLYFYDTRVCSFVEQLTPSERGELEITDLNNLYLKDHSLKAICIDDGCNWFDVGTIDALLDASNAVRDSYRESC